MMLGGEDESAGDVSAFLGQMGRDWGGANMTQGGGWKVPVQMGQMCQGWAGGGLWLLGWVSSWE